MFTPQSQPQPTKYFLPWLDEVVLSFDRQRHAEQILKKLAEQSDDIAKLRLTPQSAPHHAEGPLVNDHLVRMLALVAAFEQRSSLAEVEEVIREKNFLLELQSLEATLRDQTEFLSAYVIAHDLGKIETVSVEGLVGAIPYDKHFRAFAAKNPTLSGRELQAAYYAKEKIRVHYRGHDRLGASERFAATRQLVMRFFDVPLSSARLMSELIRVHMDVIVPFTRSVDIARYQTLVALPDRLGLNKELFLELIPAALFLDAVAGSLHTDGQHFFSDLTPLLNWYRAEREVSPSRHEERVLAAQRGRKQLVKETLTEAGLEAEHVFALLATPHGPVRGKVMEDVYELIRRPQTKVDFGPHTPELRQRAELARQLLSERNLQL